MGLKQLMITALATASLFTSPALTDGHKDAVWKAVHENSFRTEADTVRDIYRHPVETLRFFDITETSTLAEVNPGGGWYSRILAPLVKEKGRYVGLEHHPDLYASMEDYARRLAAFPEKVAADKALYGPRAVGTWIPAKEGLPTEAGSIDVIFVARAMHNWVNRDFLDRGLEQAWQLLKDGGVLGVVQHRIPESFDADRKKAASQGRWKQADLISAIEAHGFKLVASSEINANPKDVYEYERGVWTLPPVLALAEKDRAKYEAIGESDRMTLKFVKVPR